MNQWLEPGSKDAHVQAKALSRELSRRGFGIILYTTGGHQAYPCIQVTTPTWWFTEVTEFIYVAPGDDGGWQFWWSSLEPIGPAGEVGTAADKIRTRLR